MTISQPLRAPRELDLSIVVPLYKEEENVDPAVAEILEVLDTMDLTAELLLVDDGSPDSTGVLAQAWARRDPRVRVLQFRRNFGQTAAIQAGFDNARGQVVVVMDGDQQNDPHDIPLLLTVMSEGYDVVSGWRKNRQDRTLTRKVPSKVANRLISAMTGTNLHDYGCTLKAYDAEVVEHLHLYGELHRFIPALAGQSGARVAEVAVNHRPRTRGKSKYGLSRAPRVLLDLLTVQFLLRYLAKPMQLFGKLGLISFLVGNLMLLLLIWQKIALHESIINHPLFLQLAALAIILGALLLCTGVLAELLTRIYHEVGRRNPYVLRTSNRLIDLTGSLGPDAAPGSRDHQPDSAPLVSPGPPHTMSGA